MWSASVVGLPGIIVPANETSRSICSMRRFAELAALPPVVAHQCIEGPVVRAVLVALPLAFGRFVRFGEDREQRRGRLDFAAVVSRSRLHAPALVAKLLHGRRVDEAVVPEPRREAEPLVRRSRANDERVGLLHRLRSGTAIRQVEPLAIEGNGLLRP